MDRSDRQGNRGFLFTNLLIPFVLCFVDIDWLKYVNDVFGHKEGDRYLHRVAGLLQFFSEDACVSRLGGDEFMVLASGFTEAAAETRLAALRDSFDSVDYTTKGGKIISYPRSVSYGVVEVKADNMLTAGDLLSLADDRMYAYKRACQTERRDMLP